MPKVMRVCKVCGKSYEACHTPNWGVFRWRDIACSYECASEYFRMVEEARSAGKTTAKTDTESESGA